MIVRNEDLVRPSALSDQLVDIDPQALSLNDGEAADQVCRLLEARGFVRRDYRGTSGDGI